MVVRDEIRRTMVEELQMLTVEIKRAAEVSAENRPRRRLARRACGSVAVALLCTGIPIAIVRWALPSEPKLPRCARGETK